jgi:hypothetical protein
MYKKYMNRPIILLVSILLLLSSCKDNQLKVIENCADENYVKNDIETNFKAVGLFHNKLLEPVELKIALLKTESKTLLKAGFTEKEVTDHIRSELKLLKKDLDNLQIRKIGLQNGYQDYRKELLSFLKKNSSNKINNNQVYLANFKSCEIASKDSTHTFNQRFQKETYTEILEVLNNELLKVFNRYQLLKFDIEKANFKNFTL